MAPPLRTPSRRMTLGGNMMDSSAKNRKNRRMSFDVSDSLPQQGRRPPRKSMIPRGGGENQAPPRNMIPPSPSNSVTKQTQSSNRSRRSSYGGGGRRHSLIPTANPPAFQKDPRNLNDKAFQQKCIKSILQFLQKTQYDLPVSTKTLARPSGKDFASIVTHMMRQIDPQFGDGSAKLEDEVALNYKTLGYPFPVSKTALVAAGSPHTWPSLLAALAWLVDHVQILSLRTTLTPANLPENASIEQVTQATNDYFYDYVGKVYSAFLDEDAAKIVQLEGDLSDRFESDDALIESCIALMTDENALMVEKMGLLNSESQDLPTFSKKRQDYETDLEQFRDLLLKMDEHKAALQVKIQERKAELESTNQKLDRMNKHVHDLKETISSQEMSVEDLRRIESQQKGITEAIERTLRLREERETSLAEIQEKLDEHVLTLDALVTTYNSKLVSELNIPEAATLPKAKLNKDRLAEDDVVGIDMDGVHKSVEALHKAYSDKADQAKWEHQDSLDRRIRIQQALQDAQSRLKILESQHKQVHETLQQAQEAHETKLEIRQREHSALTEKVQAQRNPAGVESQVARYEVQKAELEANLESARARRQEESDSAEEEIQSAIQAMREHEEYIEKECEALEAYWNAKQAALPVFKEE